MKLETSTGLIVSQPDMVEGDLDYGFKDGESLTTEYTYDDNGNMIEDLNKDLDIEYNFLNLPKKVSTVDTNNDDQIVYIYDAAGTKWVKTVSSGSSLNQKTLYAGSFVYRDDDGDTYDDFSLDYILNQEGKIDMTGTTLSGYHYFIKDHLGNTRVVFNENGTPLQVSEYYPFGMAFNNSLGGENKYLYNGKELQDDDLGGVNLDWYDFHARFYDAALGRWHSIDPLAEDLAGISPYNFCYNNPLTYNDPTGMIGELASTFVDETGKVVEHRDDGDPNVYLVTDVDAWKKGGKKKDGLAVVGFEDPNKDYNEGDQYTYYNPREDPNFNNEYMIPGEAYDYSQDVIDGKFTEDWAYILYGTEGTMLSRYAKIMKRDITAPDNRGTVVEAGVSVIPGGVVFRGLGKGYKYVRTIGGKFHVFEKVVPASKLSGQARSVYQKVYNSEGKLIRVMKKDYKIDGRMYQNKPKHPNFPDSKQLK